MLPTAPNAISNVEVLSFIDDYIAAENMRDPLVISEKYQNWVDYLDMGLVGKEEVRLDRAEHFK